MIRRMSIFFLKIIPIQYLFIAHTILGTFLKNDSFQYKGVIYRRFLLNTEYKNPMENFIL